MEAFVLSDADWDDLKLLFQLLQPFKEATLAMECSKTPTFHKMLVVLTNLLYNSPTLLKSEEDDESTEQIKA